MFDFSFIEILVVIVVTLLVVKPEDVPGILRAVGRGLGKLKQISNEWASILDDISKDVGADDIKREMRTVVDLDGNEREAFDVSDLDGIPQKELKKTDENG